MKWHNAVRDHLPGTSGTVLISYKGVYHVAYYDQKSNQFILTEEGSLELVPDTNIYWSWVEGLRAGEKDNNNLQNGPTGEENLTAGNTLPNAGPDEGVPL